MVSLNQVLSAAVALALVYFTYKFFFSSVDVQNNPATSANFGSGSLSADGDDERDIVATMAANKKRVVVFYGSQTGTAEDLASKLAKELSSKFGLKSMTADPENFEFDSLDVMPEDNLAVFLMASYGEGEPTDNAQEFMTFITSSPSFSEGGEELPNFQFAVFGLGNTSYELYNKVGKDLNECFEKLGAQRIGAYGEGDDGKGTLEEDFMAWKDQFFEALARKWHLQEREAVYEPSIEVNEKPELSVSSADVYLGEPNLKHLVATKEGVEPKGPYTVSNPLLAKVSHAHQLFHHTVVDETNRECVHMELDTTGLKYTTGDHLAVWAQNSEAEIARFLTALGLSEKRDHVIAIKLLDTTSSVRVPSPTTYDTIVRYYLEINGPVSRQVLSSIAPFAPTPEAKAEALRLASDKELFHKEVVQKCFNLGRLMLMLSNNQPWTDVPFNFVIETIPHLTPRYYSISSSSLETPNQISITAVVERQRPSDAEHEIRGVVTNNILAIENALNGKPDNSYNLKRPQRQTDESIRLPVHVRHSLFKLPNKATVPIIMVGPGTGVAPFRGFIHERAELVKKGTEVGKALLFFGARRKDSEFLYGDEWPQHSAWLDVETAFSRDGPHRVYVQDKMRARAAELNRLIEEGAVFYVCGDASHMAREVQETLIEIIAQERGISHDEAEKVVRKMRSRNKYQEDVW